MSSENTTSVADLVRKLRSGDRRALARALTWVDNRKPGHQELLDTIYPQVGHSWRVGLTGPPGAGKSTLANRLIRHYRENDSRVAYVAVDPTSPFSGGALLGDRVRIDDEPGDDFFGRSIASRGILGGLSLQTEAVTDVIDAAGFDLVLVESVGVGQAEIEIARSVDTVVVVLVPESGDDIQAMKAGLLEIADIIAVNKSDRAAADALVSALRGALDMRSSTSNELPPVLPVSASGGAGMEELIAELEAHRKHLVEGSGWRQKRDARFRRRVEEVVRIMWEQHFWNEGRNTHLREAVAELDAASRRPYALARHLLATYGAPEQQ